MEGEIMNESKNKTRQIRKKRISTEDIIDYINWSLITDNMKMIKNSSLINVQKLVNRISETTKLRNHCENKLHVISVEQPKPFT